MKHQSCSPCYPEFHYYTLPPTPYRIGGVKQNPFAHVYGENFVSPHFIDVDNDGDLDMVLGNEGGGTFFYRNDGNRTNPMYVILKSVDNPVFGSVMDGECVCGGGV